MNPVKWTGIIESNTNTSDTNWYNYQAQSQATDGKTSSWANVKMTDGSYYVWIPRYCYKIIYFDTEPHANDYRINGLTTENNAWIQGYSTVYGILDKNKKVIDGTSPNINQVDRVKTEGYTDYVPHPAFLGVGYEDLGGGFGTSSKGTPGFWMAKFEASNSANKPLSVPNVQSWKGNPVGTMYTNAYNYNRTYDSHLIKNSEWGAVAYLTHSRYGRNGSEVRINNNTEGYTGWGATTHNAAQVSYNGMSTANLWTGQYGQLASTTGNVAGVYDMSGGTWEYVAVFNRLYSGTYYTNYGASFASYLGNSTKYATAYDNTNALRYAIKFADFADGRDTSRTGDAMREVWVKDDAGWFVDYSYFVSLQYPFLNRGR